MKAALYLAVTASCIAPALAQRQNAWRVGAEREIDHGVYATLYAEESGWRIWRLEERDYTYCTANKAGAGMAHPRPLGDGTRFGAPSAWVELSFGRMLGETLTLKGRYFGGYAEWKHIGDRFWTRQTYGDSLPEMGERPIQIHVVTYRYPTLEVGLSDQLAIIDMRGLQAVRALGRRCAGLAALPSRVGQVNQ